MSDRPPDRFRVEKLGRNHQRKSFSCGIGVLDRYLQTQASQDVRRNVASVFVVTEGESSAVAAYYTLSMTSIDLSALPEAEGRRLPRYPHIPAVLLGRLAVDLRHQAQGLGKLMLMDALHNALKSSIAWYAVLVEAKDEQAVRFYEKYGFRALTDHPRRLFLSRARLEAARNS